MTDESDKFKAWGCRHRQSLILFFTLTISYSMRSCMGIALVAMTSNETPPKISKAPVDFTERAVNNRYRYSSNIFGVEGNISVIENVTLPIEADDFKIQGFFNALMLTPPYPTFKWSKKVQGAVMSSFFWGYTLLQIPAGQLAHRFGAIHMLAGAMFINCILALFLPVVSYYGGWIFTLIFRIMQGLSQACILPSMHTFFGKWAVLEERGSLTTMAYGGQGLGTVLGLVLSGVISSSPLGWPSIFRLYGILSGIIGGVLVWFAYDSPAKHPYISRAERSYIEKGLGQKEGYEKRHLPVPWSKILCSLGVYAIIVAHIGSNWLNIILYSELPAFMDKIMGISIKANGLLTALPFMAMWLASFFFSWIYDILIEKKILSVTHTRKLVNCIGSIPAAIGLVALVFVPKNIYIVETLLVIVCVFKFSSYLGFQVNHIDISPNFAGTTMSLSNFAANLVGSFAPFVTGIILTDVKVKSLWNQVFFVAAGLYFFTNLFYVIFATAEKAEWNDPDYNVEELRKAESVPMLESDDKNNV